MTPSRVVILDGYNVLHRMPGLAERIRASVEQAREALLAWCRSWLAEHRDVLCLQIVFDGDGEQTVRKAAGRLWVIYTRRGVKADEEIVALAREGGRRCTVVTDDADVARRIAREGARSQNVGAFLAASRRGASRDPRWRDEKPPLAGEERRTLDEELRARWT